MRKHREQTAMGNQEDNNRREQLCLRISEKEGNEEGDEDWGTGTWGNLTETTDMGENV